MTSLIRAEALVEDDWIRIGSDAAEGELPQAKLIVPLIAWEHRQAELLARGLPLGIWLDAGQHPETIAPALPHLALVAIHFPVFSDGRGYSSARILRDQYRFTGEIRAIGDVLRDQLFLMRRCGFDSFEIRADRDPAQALAGLRDFRNVYQHSTVDPTPPLLLRE